MCRTAKPFLGWDYFFCGVPKVYLRKNPVRIKWFPLDHARRNENMNFRREELSFLGASKVILELFSYALGLIPLNLREYKYR